MSIAACLVALAAAATLRAAETGSLQLTLPPAWYGVPGVPISLYYDNIVLTETPEQYRFTVQCDIGKAEARRWTVTPADAAVGDHAVSVSVADASGKLLQKARTTLRVVRRDAGKGKSTRLLIVGDSLTNATAYPNEIARLLSLPDNPAWTMFGTHKTANATKGVAHEGYGGWTWRSFVSRYEPKPEPEKRKISSPFVFPGADGKPALDLPRYFKESCKGERPDYVTFLLGINDCFSAKPDDPKAMDGTLDAMFKEADTLRAAFRKAAPAADLGVCLTTPPNARESGFEANYKGKYHRWGWKRIQHRIVERQLERFAGKESQRIFIVPTELNLDPVDGYPDNNGVHPNVTGYKQVGATIYAWIKWRLQTTVH